LKDATCIVGSSPCQEFSYRAMPWKRAKALGPPLLGSELFNAQFRIQSEASEAAGHYIPMVVENVRGAQKWIGRAQWHYGSYYLWGDVPALMPLTWKGSKLPAGNSVGKPLWKDREISSCSHYNLDKSHLVEAHLEGRKVAMNFHEHEKTGKTGRSFQSCAVEEAGIKAVADGQGGYGGSFGWDGSPMRRGNSKSSKRKGASAMIAKIPFPLSSHIARCFLPIEDAAQIASRF
jgi:hypothetical protein